MANPKGRPKGSKNKNWVQRYCMKEGCDKPYHAKGYCPYHYKRTFRREENNEYCKEYREKNKEKLKKYIENNREKNRERARQYYRTPKGKARAKAYALQYKPRARELDNLRRMKDHEQRDYEKEVLSPSELWNLAKEVIEKKEEKKKQNG